MQPFDPGRFDAQHHTVSGNRPTVTGAVPLSGQSTAEHPRFNRVMKEIGVALLVCLTLVLIGAVFPRS